jgi:DNA-binding transcriptional LysR family regulator
MQLRQLEYFVAVAEEANFTRAAARVNVAQPGVSAQIRRLERELGQELLDRSGRTVRLTQAGAAVLPYARAALAAVTGARHAVDELAGLVRGHVTIGTVTSHNVDLAGLLAGFHEDHPAVEITLAEAASDQLVESLQTGLLDAAIISLADGTPPGIELHVVADEPLVAAVSHHHALAPRTTISVRDLREEPLISLPKGSGLRASLDGAFATTGVSPRVAFEASDPETVAELAGRGLGVAILPQSVATARPRQLRAIALTRPKLRGRLAFAWRAEGPISPAARTLIRHAGTVLPSSDGVGPQ